MLFLFFVSFWVSSSIFYCDSSHYGLTLANVSGTGILDSSFLLSCGDLLPLSLVRYMSWYARVHAPFARESIHSVSLPTQQFHLFMDRGSLFSLYFVWRFLLFSLASLGFHYIWWNNALMLESSTILSSWRCLLILDIICSELALHLLKIHSLLFLVGGRNLS